MSLPTLIVCALSLTSDLWVGWHMSQHDMKEKLELELYSPLSALTAIALLDAGVVFLHTLSCWWSSSFVL